MGVDQQAAGAPPIPSATLEWEVAPADGSLCALLTPALKRALAALTGGQTLEARLRGDLTGAREDIASWARLTGNDLLAVYEDAPDALRVYLRKKADA